MLLGGKLELHGGRCVNDQSRGETIARLYVFRDYQDVSNTSCPLCRRVDDGLFRNFVATQASREPHTDTAIKYGANTGFAESPLSALLKMPSAVSWALRLKF
jgi:hypothetical protein